MDRETARQALTDMLVAVQKARSNLREGIGDDDIGEAINTALHPWLFGPKSVLPNLAAYVSKIEAGGPIRGSDLYNFMWIGTRSLAIGLEVYALSGRDLPEPDLSWYAQTW